MAKLIIIFSLCLSSVYSISIVNMEKDIMPEKMDDPTMVETAKLKRDFSYHHSTPCPQYGPHYHQTLPKVQFIHQPSYIPKPTVVIKPIHHQPIHGYGHVPSYGLGHGSYPLTQPKIVIQKPHYQSYSSPLINSPSYHHVPNYHASLIKPSVIVKPDCPPYGHSHYPQHQGIAYAPQHQYNHHEIPRIKYVHQEPTIVKVVKPTYDHYNHHQSPFYHQSSPIYHQPVYHHPVHHHVPKVEICD